MPFQDITITGLLKERSCPIQGSFFRIFLQLSDTPSGDWSQLFDSVWATVFYSMKRRAGVEGDAIWVDCVPEEIKQCHLEELKKAITETNTHYRAFLRLEESKKKQEEDIKKQNEKRLDGLGDGLKF